MCIRDRFLNFDLTNILKTFAGHASIKKSRCLHLLSTLFAGWAFIFALVSPFNCEGEAADDLLALDTKKPSYASDFYHLFL